MILTRVLLNFQFRININHELREFTSLYTIILKDPFIHKHSVGSLITLNTAYLLIGVPVQS